MTSAQILVIDDEPDLRTLYELTLLRAGYQVEVAGSVAEAWQQLDAHRFDVVITDMRLPDGLGISIIQKIRELQRSERCVVITAHGSAVNAVESLKAGAFDYLTKPVDLKQFRTVIASAVQDAASRPPAMAPGLPAGNADKPVGAAQEGAAALQRLVGDSEPMRLVRERIVKVARSMAPVLIRGESGTGKELVANALHANSHRHAGPLVAVNCSAIPENLLESEFFGVKKGAFTGATQDRDGFFQAARGGTLFLDEIGDLPLSMQSKLLRAIQERCVRPVGSTQEDPVDVRIISATHKDLVAEVQTERFRQDLYYRLNVIEIFIPALRERRSDLPALCLALLARIAAEAGVAPPRLTLAALESIARNPLTGNVRELENLLHRAVTLGDGDEQQMEAALAASLPPMAAVPPPRSSPTQDSTETPPHEQHALAIPHDLQSHLDQQERDILIKTLQATGYNRTAAAARLGISLRQIRYRITRLGIDMPASTEVGDDAS